jgi:hypothetical protein
MNITQKQINELNESHAKVVEAFVLLTKALEDASITFKDFKDSFDKLGVLEEPDEPSLELPCPWCRHTIKIYDLEVHQKEKCDVAVKCDACSEISYITPSMDLLTRKIRYYLERYPR